MKTNIKNMLLITVAVLIMVNSLTPIAYASSTDWLQGIKNGASDLWDTVTEKGSEAADTIREKGPGWVESGKEAVGNIVDKTGTAIQDAVDWNVDQYHQFWDRTTTQVYGSTPAPEQTQALESIQPVPSAQPESSSKDPKPISSSPPPPEETLGVILSADEAHEAASALPEPTSEIVYHNPDPTPAPDLNGTLYYNGQWYRQVEEGGDFRFDGHSYVETDSPVGPYTMIADNIIIIDGNIIQMDKTDPSEEIKNADYDPTDNRGVEPNVNKTDLASDMFKGLEYAMILVLILSIAWIIYVTIGILRGD